MEMIFFLRHIVLAIMHGGVPEFFSTNESQTNRHMTYILFERLKNPTKKKQQTTNKHSAPHHTLLQVAHKLLFNFLDFKQK